VRRLSGWKRIGIVASVVWAVGGFIWGNNQALKPERLDYQNKN